MLLSLAILLGIKPRGRLRPGKTLAHFSACPQLSWDELLGCHSVSVLVLFVKTHQITRPPPSLRTSGKAKHPAGPHQLPSTSGPGYRLALMICPLCLILTAAALTPSTTKRTVSLQESLPAHLLSPTSAPVPSDPSSAQQTCIRLSRLGLPWSQSCAVPTAKAACPCSWPGWGRQVWLFFGFTEMLPIQHWSEMQWATQDI